MKNSAEGAVVNLPIRAGSLASSGSGGTGCVAERDRIKRALRGGALMGVFAVEDRDREPCNILLVTWGKAPMHFGHLAHAFGSAAVGTV